MVNDETQKNTKVYALLFALRTKCFPLIMKPVKTNFKSFIYESLLYVVTIP